MSLVNYMAPKEGDSIALIVFPKEQAREYSLKPDRERQRMEFYERFVNMQKAIDSARVRNWTDKLVKRRDISKWSDWLRLVVTLDAIKPPVRRELFVSPNVSMAVSTPSVGTIVLGFTLLCADDFRVSRRSSAIKYSALQLDGRRISMRGRVDASLVR